MCGRYRPSRSGTCPVGIIVPILQKEKSRCPRSPGKVLSELGLGSRSVGSQPQELSVAQVAFCHSRQDSDSTFQMLVLVLKRLLHSN